MTELHAIRANEVYVVLTPCPQCSEVEGVILTVEARMERTKAAGKVGLKLGQERVPHRCEQTALQVVAETGEIVQLDLGDR